MKKKKCKIEVKWLDMGPTSGSQFYVVRLYDENENVILFEKARGQYQVESTIANMKKHKLAQNKKVVISGDSYYEYKDIPCYDDIDDEYYDDY